jgi:polar amino acid transport system substrate-binding protein
MIVVSPTSGHVHPSLQEDRMTTRRTLLGGSAALAATIALGAEFAAAQESSPVAATPIAIPAIEDLPLRQPGKLTIHADQPLYPPWFIDNDPTNGQGFESAVAYAIARAMGFTEEQVEWGYTSFNASYSPGPKDFDFYITEVSITEEREQAVDFSDPYYSEPLIIVTQADSPVLEARSISELREFRFATQVGTTFHRYIENTIQPADLLVFDTNADSLQALVNETVDAVIQTYQIGIFNTTIQFEGLALGGILPGTSADLGLVLEEGSALTPFLNDVLTNLRNDGTLAALEEEWLPIPPEIYTYTED